MITLLKELCALPGVSGCEDRVREYIKEYAAGKAQESFEDSMGNLFLFKKGKKRPDKKLMLCAHMDEVGLIVKSVTEDGYLKFAPVGGLDRRVLIGKRVRVVKNNTVGVIGIKAVHLTTAEERKTVAKTDAMYIDIGSRDKGGASALAAPGDYLVFDEPPMEFGNNCLCAKAIDDRIGCAVMLKLLDTELEYDAWFVFTVQEEVGARGAAIAANRLSPNVCLLLEGTTAADYPDIKKTRQVCRAGGGLVIPFMDRSTVYDKGIYNTLTQICDEQGIKWQTKEYIAGGTDAGTIHVSGGGVRCGCIAAPVRNIHSQSCVLAMEDTVDIVKLATLALSRLGGN